VLSAARNEFCGRKKEGGDRNGRRERRVEIEKGE